MWYLLFGILRGLMHKAFEIFFFLKEGGLNLEIPFNSENSLLFSLCIQISHREIDQKNAVWKALVKY